MASEEQLRAAHARVAAEIAALVVECDLAVQDANVARSYLEHEEFGVALEYLCDTLIETDAPITEAQCRRVLESAKALGLLKREPQEWSQRMETLLGNVRPGEPS